MAATRIGDEARYWLPDLMRRAIAEADRADRPFGCVLADLATGELLLGAANASRRDPTDHAEMVALRAMARLAIDPASVLLVSTAEPCPLCASASYWSGIPAIVFGTSIATLIRSGWRQIDLPCTDLFARANPPVSVEILGGFLADETDRLYTSGPTR